DSKVLSSAISIVMAQRLVRTLCRECSKKRAPTAEEKKIIESVISNISPSAIKHIEIPSLESVGGAVGCPVCNNTGYKGRTGIYEAIEMNEEIEKIARENPSERDIKKAALPQGILTMAEDGVLKVLRGITTLDELGRVIEISSV
ncbi:MAG: hypothetical protein AAB682_03155, partial [Patescibacteria group bacterium]